MNDFLNSLERKPKGTFVFIDDDKDEHHLLELAMEELGLPNPVVHCMDGMEAFNYLKETKDEIFIILSDLNMPVMDGLELKRLVEITPELKIRAIPFIFHSNTGSTAEIKAAYASNIQGYLKKAPSIEGTIKSLQKIIALWTDCVHPKDIEEEAF
ncbi:MAG TPA: response regulator [Bacteroidia bacterium]|jgi:CheY-like chemotaxis protein